MRAAECNPKHGVEVVSCLVNHRPAMGLQRASMQEKSVKSSRPENPPEISSMNKRLDRAHRAIPLILGVVTLFSVGMLLAWHVNPKFFPPRAHDFLAAFPLAMI